jgi:Mg/Co/Ni transporter MgtE
LNDDTTVSMPEEIKVHLLDLENGSENIEMFIDMKSEKNNLRFNEEEVDDDDFVALLLDEVKRKVKKPSLDQLLEKISKNGVESLSTYEKETLEYYSKNYQ